MNKLVINNFEEFEQYVGKELGVSDYMQITQEQINKFARCDFRSSVDTCRCRKS